MNKAIFNIFALVALIVAAISVAEAHKKFYGQSAPQYDGRQDGRCLCECGPQGPIGPQPILPNKPYYGSAGYGQPPPRPSNGGYGNSGSYAVSGSYGGGSSQVSGGY